MAEKRKFNEEDMDGKIVRIKLKDFLTYDDCEFKPGEKLNVILGPNGTGKSSIVCAICLGLGGRTNLLGRAKLLSDYVKHRKKEATIEIELFKKNESNLIVRRTFNTQSTNSKFEINGRVVTESAVINTVKKMNIQMDNLCQFLPQDRVIEFAKMNARELLVATEKAVGPDGMHADHVKLIDLRKKSGELESMIDGRKTYKEQIETSNQRLERDVKRYKEREKHQEKIQILKKKRPWVLYEEARKETIAAKDAKKVVEKKIKDMRKKHSPLKEKIDKAKVALKKAEDEIKVLSAEMNKTGQDMKKIDDKLEKQNDRIAEARQDFTSVQQDEQERHKKISQLEKQIESLQREYEEAPDPEAMKPRITEIHNEVKAIQHQLNELNRQKTEILSDNTNLKLQITALKRRLAEVDNVDHQKLETLRRVDSDTYNAVLWLRQNKQMFSGTVYEPIMTQINMHDMKNAFYLENAISFRDMKAFVCQNREDQKLLSNQVN
ncbi:structural maintenance of chromosomes protein 5-like [Clytia hemisphaerica]